MSNTNSDEIAPNPIGIIGDVINTALGLAIANEFKNLVDKGISPSVAKAMIESSAEFSAASKVFGPIGITMSGMALTCPPEGPSV